MFNVNTEDMFRLPIRTIPHKEFIILRETIKALLKIFFRLEIYGEENLDLINPNGGLIVVANHQAGLDAFLMGMILPKHIHIIMNVKAFPHPLILKASHYFGVIPYIPRKTSDWTNKRITEILDRGEYLGIFPEGAIHPLKKDYFGKKGFAKYALINHVPVLPLGIIGTLTVNPKKDYFKGITPPPFRKITVNIGRPLKYSPNIVNEQKINDFKDYVMYKIRLLSNWYGVPKRKKEELLEYYEEKKGQFVKINQKLETKISSI